ncbi:MAG: endonuclease Q family protein [Candidatus Woesearchaeota archaeon]|nr:endonuclease Q family protein [Candidatus Woesearchaeota archaeon]
MKIISDLHIHSRFSRATSIKLDLLNLEKWARVKGVNLLGTGDFTHPKWITELKNNLKEEDGILKSKTGFDFLLQTEISNIYTQDGRGRRVHNIILAPSFDVVDQINEALGKKGRLDYDGRPIFGFSCVELVDMMNSISKDIEIIPAHAWTPWFSIFGSMSGFNSVEECFLDRAKYIHALETGLSSDPAMNWRLSKLDNYALVSFSDLHSFWPWRLGREATVFDINLNYKNLINAIRTRKGLVETIEVDPAYGKYHYDGHRMCNVCLSPDESLKLKDICPKCGRKLTIGVAHRVEELADRDVDYKPKNAIPFKTLIPLSELLSVYYNQDINTKLIWNAYNKIIEKYSELDVLLELSPEQLKEIMDTKLINVILQNREGKIKVKPGYDGMYGVPILDVVYDKKQKSLMDF